MYCRKTSRSSYTSLRLAWSAIYPAALPLHRDLPRLCGPLDGHCGGSSGGTRSAEGRSQGRDQSISDKVGVGIILGYDGAEVGDQAERGRRSGEVTLHRHSEACCRKEEMGWKRFYNITRRSLILRALHQPT